jgi:hypothetical protein
MTTQIELRDVVAVQMNDTVTASNSTTTWREVHIHKISGEIVTLTLWPYHKGRSVPVTFGDEDFDPNEDGEE